MQTITITGLVVPEFLAFKLLKEISQGNVACKPRGFIGAEPARFEQHTHRVTPANNSPSPRRRMCQIADKQVELLKHTLPRLHRVAALESRRVLVEMRRAPPNRGTLKIRQHLAFSR